MKTLILLFTIFLMFYYPYSMKQENIKEAVNQIKTTQMKHIKEKGIYSTAEEVGGSYQTGSSYRITTKLEKCKNGKDGFSSKISFFNDVSFMEQKAVLYHSCDNSIEELSKFEASLYQ